MAETPKDGGPAQMELRDWFAGQALVGIVRDRTGKNYCVEGRESGDWIARQAYDMADRMLAARSIQEG